MPNQKYRAAMPDAAADARRDRSWASLLLMLVMIGAVFASVDWVVQMIVPNKHLREAADGIADLRNGDPITLVVGSSHARTFHALGQELDRRTGRKGELVAIPLEYGKLTSYRWLLEHRVLPLLDERDEAGRRVRSRLRNFVLLTAWWDSCDAHLNVYSNLPGRAWDLKTYVRDVAQNGFTPYNRNFLRYHVTRALEFSALLGDDGNRRLMNYLKSRVYAREPELAAKAYASDISGWQEVLEAGSSCIGAADQMQALEAIIRAARVRGLDVRIVLFPLKPDTVTPKAESTTLRLFHELVQEVARRNGVKVLDMTLTSPLESSDWMLDFDHLNPEGDRKFSDWALAGPFADLMNASPEGAVGGASTR